MMGSGKTTVGKLLAARIAYAFVDTDDEIEKRANMSPDRIFSELGEQKFRQMEYACLDQLAKRHHVVVATGGGIGSAPRLVQSLSKRGLVIYLRAAVDTLARRLADEVDQRPLLSGAGLDVRTTLAKILRARATGYEHADMIIDVDELTPEAVVERLVSDINSG